MGWLFDYSMPNWREVERGSFHDYLTNRWGSDRRYGAKESDLTQRAQRSDTEDAEKNQEERADSVRKRPQRARAAPKSSDQEPRSPRKRMPRMVAETGSR